jgi:cellobiose PTS system EIIC component
VEKLVQWLERYFVPIAGRIGSQRHLVAIRDGFVAIMPLILIGSLAVLINNLPIDAFQNFMLKLFGESWKVLGGNIWNGTFAIMSLLVAVGVSYNLARSYQVDGLSSALVTFGALVILSPPTEKEWGIAFAWLGAQGLFVALITSIVVTEIFRKLLQSRFTIKMPAGVPPAVARSFAALIPAAVVLVLVGALQLFIVKATKIGSLHQWVFETIQQPLEGLAGSLPSAIILALLIHLLWFFGLHGANIVGPVIDSIYLPRLEKNIALFNAGTSAHDVPNIVTKPFFDVFVHMGGAGTTLALIVAIFLVAKSAQLRGVGKLTAPAGLFNINEPVLFGVPIVLNPIMLIPFVFIPVILTLTSYFAISFGIVPKTVALVPWTMPPIIAGYLVTGGTISGAILQIFNFALAVLLYIPFIKVNDNYILRNDPSKKKVSVVPGDGKSIAN